MAFQLESDEDEKPDLYVDKIRTCPRCQEKFLSVARKVRPFFIPLFCLSCDKINGEALRRKELKLPKLPITAKVVAPKDEGIFDLD